MIDYYHVVLKSKAKKPPVSYGEELAISEPVVPGCWSLMATLSVFQALGATTTVPVTGPQVSSLQRLAGQGAAVLPQVNVCLSRVCPPPRAASEFPFRRCIASSVPSVQSLGETFGSAFSQ